MGQEKTAKKAPAFAPPLASFKGYKASNLMNDFVAGVVIAALSIPIAMGYADIAGLPPVYGLWASIVAPLVFALVTGTRHIVFGMDSAASAMTGGMLVSVGVALGTDQTIAVMPMLTLFTALFLLLFSLVRAGKVIRLVPIPAMHGFIVGISVTVILTQLPLLASTTADTSGWFGQDVVNVFTSLATTANIPSVILSIGCLASLVLLKKFFSRIPGALVVLVAATIIVAAFNLTSQGVVTLSAVEAGLPQPVLPDFGAFDLLSIVMCSFAIAVVVALESLLCLETFSMKKGIRANGGRELFSFGFANVFVALFGCPPCSASISRTAAGMSSGSKSEAAAIVSALVVAIVALACGPVLSFLPRAALSSIVVLALIEVCDFKKIRRYATKMPSEFVVFLLSALVVIVWGAIPGIIAGFVISVLFLMYRHFTAKQELLGAVSYEKYNVPDKCSSIDPGFITARFKMSGEYSFLNIDATIDRLLATIGDDAEALILKMSKVESLDTTATDKLLQLLEMLYMRGIHVKIVRKVRPTNDHYTRFEMRTLMSKTKFYPNVRTALESLRLEYETGSGPRKPEEWLEDEEDELEEIGDSGETISVRSGDRPVLTVVDEVLLDAEAGVVLADLIKDNCVKLDAEAIVDGSPRTVSGKLSYLQSGEVFLFKAAYATASLDPDEVEAFLESGVLPYRSILITRESTGLVVAEYHDGEKFFAVSKESISDAFDIIGSFMAGRLRNFVITTRREAAEAAGDAEGEVAGKESNS